MTLSLLPTQVTLLTLRVKNGGSTEFFDEIPHAKSQVEPKKTSSSFFKNLHAIRFGSSDHLFYI